MSGKKKERRTILAGMLVLLGFLCLVGTAGNIVWDQTVAWWQWALSPVLCALGVLIAPKK